MAGRELIRRGSEETREMDERRAQTIPLENLIDAAVQEGTAVLAQRHPIFGDPKFLAQYLDPKKLRLYATEVSQQMQKYQKEGKDPKELVERAYKTLAGKIASGALFNERGKEIIFSRGLHEKSRRWFGGGQAKEILKGEEYLEEALRSFRDLYNLMASGDYAQRFPELAKAVDGLYKLGNLDAVTRVLYQNGQLKEGQYIALKRAMGEKVRQRIGETQQTLKHYYSEALATSILVIIGIGVLASTTTLTGNVIGITQTSIVPAITFGALSLVLGIYLWMNRK